MASLSTLGFTTKLELSSVSQRLFNLNMFLVFGSLTNWDGLWWSPIVILRWGRLFGFWPRPCWPREQQWQVINHHQHYNRHHHREYEDTKIIVCLTKVKSQSTESRILKQLFTFEASLHRDGWALRGWCRPTLNCHAGGRGCGGQSWFFMMTTMIIVKQLFFQEKHTSVPLFLVGHSMGGMIALRCVIRLDNCTSSLTSSSQKWEVILHCCLPWR